MSLSESIPGWLSQELAVSRDFEALLEQERKALVSNNFEPLAEISAKKVQLIQRFADRALIRREYLSLPGTSTRFKRQKLPPEQADEPVQQALSQLRDCARSIQELSQHNEMLINLRLQHIRAARSVLMRQEPDVPDVYAADGRAHTTTAIRTRATA